MNNELNNNTNNQQEIDSLVDTSIEKVPLDNAKVTVENIVEPVSDSMPQRVQLINDTPSLKAIAPNDIGSKNNEEKNLLLNNSSNDKNSDGNNNVNNKIGCGQNIFLFLLFGGLFLFILNLDTIRNFVETRKYLKTQNPTEITTGTLKCKLTESTSNMDYDYSADFDFRDKQLKRLSYTLEIRGDMSLDEEALNLLYNDCLRIKQYASNLSGISITCDLEGGLLRQKQIFTYDSVNRDEALSAFVEAGGIYPEYRKDQNIDEIEKSMNASRYNCERIQ